MMIGRGRPRLYLGIFAVLISASIYLRFAPIPPQHTAYLKILVGLQEPAPKADVDPNSRWSPDRWFYELDVFCDSPRFDLDKLSALAPHNYQGPGHETYACLFNSRNGSMRDPYFVATQQILYRLLWDPRSKTEKHPVVVFVAPFIPEEQRAYFRSAGAIVREVGLLPFEPNQLVTGKVANRLRDVFSKLEMWTQTDFTKIAYLDSDAFPMVNIDEIFDIAPVLECKRDLLAAQNLAHADELCEYVLAGWREPTGSVNAGVIVIKPNDAMHMMLVREYHNDTNFDNGFMEQAFLNYVFRKDGPFPPTEIGDKWNASPDFKGKGKEIAIIHSKLWATFFAPEQWEAPIFNETWKDMLALYESLEFEQMREHDHAVAPVAALDAWIGGAVS